MPEREAKSHHVNNWKAVQSANAHQSAWLTHWTASRFESSKHDHLTQFSRSEANDHDIKKHPIGVQIASDNFGSSKGIRDVDLAKSLKKPGGQSFPFFKHGLESGRSSISNERETRGVQALGPQVSHKKLTTALNVETSARECHFQPERVSQIPTEQVKYHLFFGESSYSCSRPSKEKFAGSATHINMEPERPNYCSHSAALVSEGNLNNLRKREKAEMPSFLRQNSAALLKNDPSTSSNRSPAFLEEQYKRMQKHIGMGFFPHQTGSTEMTKPGTLQHVPCSFQNIPHFVHDVEMTRMCTPISSVEGLAGGLHSFSRTTHSLLITKQTDVKVYQENQIFRESRVSTHLKEDSLRELNCSPPHFVHSQRGGKLQLLDLSDHESQENIEDVKAARDVQKNESSADTEAMDMESFKENRLSGVHLTPPNKDILVESTLRLLPPIAFSTEKDTHRKRKIELPDINLQLSAVPAASSSTEPCPSRTQSLDMNTLQLNVDQTINSKSDECSDSDLGSEPGSRWIKHLKLNASNSIAIGPKPSKLEEPSSHGKLNRFFTRVMEGKPEPAFDKCQHKQSEIQIGECSVKEQHPSLASLFGKDESSSVEMKRESKDTILGHSWIQRWSHNQGQKIPETCKAENSKLAADESQKKQFPSIAAMALMGKAMTGFQQCKFQKKESFVIWNSKASE